MGTAKRERQKANRAARLESERTATESTEKRRKVVMVVAAVAGLLLLAFLYSVFAGGDDGDQVDTTDASAETDGDSGDVADSDEGATAQAEVVDGDSESGDDELAINAPPAGAEISGETPCPAEDGSEERTTVFEQAPPMCIDPDKSYSAIMSTSLGDLTVEFDTENAPVTVNNFVVLSRYDYYDGIPFHRIVPDFVAQAGDAVPSDSGLGRGGPGYSFEDELPDSVDAYQPGTLAMANSGPDSNGSQFFIYYGPTSLPGPTFTAFGTVTEGLDTVGADLLATGTDSQEPSELVTIDDIEIIESE